MRKRRSFDISRQHCIDHVNCLASNQRVGRIQNHLVVGFEAATISICSPRSCPGMTVFEHNFSVLHHTDL